MRAAEDREKGEDEITAESEIEGRKENDGAEVEGVGEAGVELGLEEESRKGRA